MVDPSKMIFVFGSNEGGIHGAGAARFAHREMGAVMGHGYGHVGKSFAIPTKDRKIQNTLSLSIINIYVSSFIMYAYGRPDLDFQVTCIGCGLAGLDHKDIAPMFANASHNCHFDKLWEPWLPNAKFWGTH